MGVYLSGLNIFIAQNYTFLYQVSLSSLETYIVTKEKQECTCVFILKNTKVEAMFEMSSGLLNSCTSESSKNQPSYPKKANGQALRKSEVQKSAREFSHGLNLSGSLQAYVVYLYYTKLHPF